MNILIITNSCSIKKYNEIEKNRRINVLGAQQKFFNFVIRGLAHEKKNRITVLVVPPVSASSYDRYKWEYEEETVEENLTYCYLDFLNGRYLRYITQLFSSGRIALEWMKKHNKHDSIIICDPLIVHSSSIVQILSKMYEFKTVCIITDLPMFVTDVIKNRFSNYKICMLNIYDYFTYKFMKIFDAYILLTRQMNKLVNPYDKPSIVLEGISDASYDNNCFNKKSKMVEPKICLYAGGIYARFGVLKLAKAFSLTKNKGWELHFYGTGNEVEELKNFCKSHANIKYFGTAPQSEIVNIERNASLLVNPRPSAEEYTKYSFPSKTTEYMTSGTATLSTRLPGIPEDYYPYLYWFDDEDLYGMVKTLDDIMQKPLDELNEFGKKGQEFILMNKGYIVQGERIIKFLSQIQIKDYEIIKK